MTRNPVNNVSFDSQLFDWITKTIRVFLPVASLAELGSSNSFRTNLSHFRGNDDIVGRNEREIPDQVQRDILVYYILTLISYFILLFGQALWIGWLNPDPVFPKSVALLLIVAPLLLPMRGLLHGRMQTYKWVTLFIWLYFCFGIWNVVNETQWPLGVLQILSSLGVFVCCVLFVRSQAATE